MLVLMLSLSAAADISPGPLYREDCTIEQKEQEGTTCDSCSGNRPEADSGLSECESKFEGTDFTYACNTYGASTWTEVWCDGPPNEGCGGCASVSGAPAGVLLSLLMLLVARRRS